MYCCTLEMPKTISRCHQNYLGSMTKQTFYEWVNASKGFDNPGLGQCAPDTETSCKHQSVCTVQHTISHQSSKNQDIYPSKKCTDVDKSYLCKVHDRGCKAEFLSVM